MNDRISINQKQLTLILINLLIVKMIFSFPRLLFRTSGNAAWIQGIYIAAIAYLLLELSLLFLRHTKNRSILQLAELIGKKPLKIIVCLIIVAIFSANVSAEMRTYAESVKLILLPNTKIEYIMLFFAAVVAFGSFCGFGALATINAIFMPFCLFFLAALGISLVKNFNVNNIMPIFGNGAKGIFVTGLKEIYCFSDILALNLLLPYCSDIGEVKSAARRSVLTAGAVIALLCLAYGMIFPYPYSAEFMLPTYQLTRLVRAGEYFQRFEALFEFIWSVAQLLYSSIYIFLICRVISDTFRLKYSKALIPCVTSILAILSFEPSSVTELSDLSGKIMQFYAPFAYFLPIIIPAIYLLIRRKRNVE